MNEWMFTDLAKPHLDFPVQFYEALRQLLVNNRQSNKEILALILGFNIKLLVTSRRSLLNQE